MKTKEKIDKIIEFTEHPERFTDEAVSELMRDEECRMLYQTISDAGRAMAEDHEVSDDVVDEEWRKFAAKYFDGDENGADGSRSCELPRGGRVRIVPLWRSKIAAACAGFIILSGVALAMVVTRSGQTTDDGRHPADSVLVAPHNVVAGDIVVYEDSRLDSIMNDVSDHYGVTAEYANDGLRTLRFHLKWDRSRGLGDLIEVVNGFDGISIRVDGRRVIVAEQEENDGPDGSEEE